MKLWEKPLRIIYRLVALPYLKTFISNSPEEVLKRSLNVLNATVVTDIKKYLKNSQTVSGGFADKAGKPDLYYTVFGLYLANTLGLENLLTSAYSYLETEIKENNTAGVYLYCAAILYSKLGTDPALKHYLQQKVRQSLKEQLNKQPAYNAFLSLLACYYMEDYKGLYQIRNQIKTFNREASLPCPVTAALLVLQKSFNKPVNHLINEVFSFYDGKNGFRATHKTPVPDLLSTAVALYALSFAGADLREIKPDCLAFIDSLFYKGGFCSNTIDQDTDIEYTFYGLLALGALSE